MTYRDGMTEDEERELLAECERLDQCYADADAMAASARECSDDEEFDYFDPVRDGWVDRNTGRP
jgi:hypothetical protein